MWSMPIFISCMAIVIKMLETALREYQCWYPDWKVTQQTCVGHGKEESKGTGHIHVVHIRQCAE